MDSTEFASAQVVARGNTLVVSHGSDENLIVEFYLEPELQRFESEQANRPIYKDVPYVWIRFPGDRTREIRHRAKREYQMRFPRQWMAFQSGQTVAQTGTPLEQWSPLSRSQALMFKGLNIFTVENLAAVPDSALGNLGHGARDLRDKAIAWLKNASSSAEALRLASENQHLRDDIEALKAQVAELATKRKPGRPRNSEESDD